MIKIIEVGTLVTFKGFKNREEIFEFTNGKKWQQDEYKYEYRYLYRPEAIVFSNGLNYYLQIKSVENLLVKVKPVPASKVGWAEFVKPNAVGSVKFRL